MLFRSFIILLLLSSPVVLANNNPTDCDNALSDFNEKPKFADGYIQKLLKKNSLLDIFRHNSPNKVKIRKKLLQVLNEKLIADYLLIHAVQETLTELNNVEKLNQEQISDIKKAEELIKQAKFKSLSYWRDKLSQKSFIKSNHVKVMEALISTGAALSDPVVALQAVDILSVFFKQLSFEEQKPYQTIYVIIINALDNLPKSKQKDPNVISLIEKLCNDIISKALEEQRTRIHFELGSVVFEEFYNPKETLSPDSLDNFIVALTLFESKEAHENANLENEGETEDNEDYPQGFNDGELPMELEYRNWTQFLNQSMSHKALMEKATQWLLIEKQFYELLVKTMTSNSYQAAHVLEKFIELENLEDSDFLDGEEEDDDDEDEEAWQIAHSELHREHKFESADVDAWKAGLAAKEGDSADTDENADDLEPITEEDETDTEIPNTTATVTSPPINGNYLFSLIVDKDLPRIKHLLQEWEKENLAFNLKDLKTPSGLNPLEFARKTNRLRIAEYLEKVIEN